MFLASVSQDRFLRLHSTFPPPNEVGKQQEQKGEVLDKIYMKVVPTAVIVDPRDEEGDVSQKDESDAEDEEDNVWDEMETADSDVEETKGSKSTKKRKSS